MPDYGAGALAAKTKKPGKKPDKKTGPDPVLARYWREIERYDKATQDWREQGKKIVKIYRDQHRRSTDTRRFAMLWSNVETLKPAIYAKTPIVNVSRRFKDPDPVGRTAAELLERCSNSSFDLYGVDEVFRMVREDRLLPARGQAWVRYEADFEQEEAGGDEEEEETAVGEAVASEDSEPHERLAGEKVCVDHVHWLDFGHNVCRTWSEVWLVWRCVYWDRAQARERLGKDKAVKLKYTHKPHGPDIAEDGMGSEAGETAKDADMQARLYEVWDKKRKLMSIIAKGFDEACEQGPPPLNLHGFFPCPEPCYGTKTSDSLIPTPDYRYYQDQAEEIDDLTAKIGAMTEWLIVKGFIPGGPSSEGGDAVKQLIDQSGSQMFVTVESYAGFVDKGGIKDLIQWFPVEKIAQALDYAIKVREQLIQDVYQITGVSDILRGQSDPNETLGAQELKAQTGSRRVRNAKDDLARFCRDVSRLVCEVIAENFQPETIAAMSGYKYVPVVPPQVQEQIQSKSAQAGQPPMIFDDEVVQRLRDDRIRSYSIDIETDSTIQPDEDAEKQRRVEFITAFGGFLQQATGLFQLGPQAAPLAPLVSEVLKFTVRGFRAGRQMEDVIERSLDQMVQGAMQAAQQPPPPDPKMEAVKEKAKADQANLQLKAQSDQANLQLKTQSEQAKIMLKAKSDQMNFALKAREQQMNTAMQQQQMAADNENASAEREMGQQNAHADREVAREGQMLKAQVQGDGSASRAGDGSAYRGQTAPQPQQQDMGGVEELLMQIAGGIQMLLQAQMGPKRFIKDAQGRSIAVETSSGVAEIEYDPAGNVIGTGQVQRMQ